MNTYRFVISNCGGEKVTQFPQFCDGTKEAVPTQAAPFDTCGREGLQTFRLSLKNKIT